MSALRGVDVGFFPVRGSVPGVDVVLCPVNSEY